MTPFDKSAEQRLAHIENRLVIYNLLAAHPLRTNASSEQVLRRSETSDASVEKGQELHGAGGLEEIVVITQSPTQCAAIKGGLTHFSNLPLVELDGDLAVVTSYIMIDLPGRPDDVHELSNHGMSLGLRIRSVVANSWSLICVDGRSRIKSRGLSPLDGMHLACRVLEQAGMRYVPNQPRPYAR